MDSEKVIKRDNEYVLHTYARNPIVLEKGHGLYAEGPEGQKYLDFTSGIGVNSLGYCDMTWAEAVSGQAHKLQHTSNLYYTAPCGKLAKKLCKRTGMSRVFFGNSGAEANEGAIKAARKYSFDKYGADRYNVITLVNSFHGRTIATLTATGQGVFHNYFGPFNEGFQYVKAGDIDALTEMVDRHTCAVMLELVQGEGGVVALDPEYVQAVRALCDEKDLVLIVDEVQTGVGRTGTFLCCEHYNLQPDVVTLAKGLGGGLPIGAVLMNEKVAAGMGPSSHGSTFGGNPVVCAGANVVVDRMDASFLANVNERAVQLRTGLEKLPRVKSLSGIGLMVGIEFLEGIKAADVLAACREKGLLVLTAKTRLRLLPPLTLTAHDVEMALDIPRGDGPQQNGGAGMKHLLKMSDLTPDEVAHILDVADELKARQKAGGTEPLLKGKSVALMFSKNSTRTRTSFEVGVYQLGGLGNYMNAATELQSGRGEPLKDTARVLGRYYDCVVWRTYRQSDLEEFSEFAGVPVINGLTDYAHPCQVLADLMTIRERRGALAGQKLCFVGDGSNMANSLVVGGLLSGMKVDCVCPHGYRPAADVLMFAHKYGSAFRLLEDPAEGVKDADVVVTAVWNTAAPGTSESESRLRDFAGFQLTSCLLKAAKPDCMVLHCLPAHRGEEISTAVFEAHADEIFTEAENRLHVQKAVLAVLLAGK